MAVDFVKPSRPGVYVHESPLQRVTPLASNLGTYGVFIGTAIRGPLTPIPINSISDFYSIYGSFSWKKTLPPALSQFFANGGLQCFVIRVIDPDGSSTAFASFDDYGTKIAITGVNLPEPSKSKQWFFTPAGATIPIHYEDLRDHPVVGLSGTAKPPTDWAADEFIELKDGTRYRWANKKWVAYVPPQGTGYQQSTPAVIDKVSQASRSRIGVHSISPGAGGNAFGFTIRPVYKYAEGRWQDTFQMDVYERALDGTPTNIERWSDLSMDSNSPRYFLKIVNSPTIGSRYLTVKDVSTGDAIDSSIYEGTGADIVWLENGADGDDDNISSSDYAAAFDQMSDIEGLFLVNAPGYEKTSHLESLIVQRGDSVLIHDSGHATNPLLEQSQLPTSSYSASYYPWIYINDPAPGAARGSVVMVPPGASVMGMIIRTDLSRGVFKTPAGIGATLANAVAPVARINNNDLDLLADRHVNAIRSLTGVGTTVMGARTRTFGDVAQFLAVRRTLNYIKRRAVLASRFALFEPNTRALWEQIRVANGSFLSELWVSGGLTGGTAQEAFYVKVDDDNNTPATMANGELHVEIGVAPVFPAEFVIIKVGTFDGSSFVVEEG